MLKGVVAADARGRGRRRMLGSVVATECSRAWSPLMLRRVVATEALTWRLRNVLGSDSSLSPECVRTAVGALNPETCVWPRRRCALDPAAPTSVLEPPRCVSNDSGGLAR
eukprot:7023187-Alexandrium_andersonii.AAC.1